MPGKARLALLVVFPVAPPGCCGSGDGPTFCANEGGGNDRPLRYSFLEPDDPNAGDASFSGAAFFLCFDDDGSDGRGEALGDQDW